MVTVPAAPVLVATAKGALAAPPGIGTVAGTVAAELLLHSLTVMPLPEAARFRVTLPSTGVPPITLDELRVTLVMWVCDVRAPAPGATRARASAAAPTARRCVRSTFHMMYILSFLSFQTYSRKLLVCLLVRWHAVCVTVSRMMAVLIGITQTSCSTTPPSSASLRFSHRGAARLGKPRCSRSRSDSVRALPPA